VVDAVRVARLLRSLDEGLASLSRRQGTAAVALAVGFRNVLVREYVDVDDQIVIERLHNHEDLHEYSRPVSQWLSRQ